jgi:hypothetical protein
MTMHLRLILTLTIAATLASCSSFTREEKDMYTITRVDTTRAERVHNPPGDRDNGVVYPSSRTVEIKRDVVQTDSIVTREYPNFIRFGAFEGIGLIGSGRGGQSVNLGAFGMYPDIDLLFAQRTDTSSSLFTGSVHRFGIMEWRLRWFDDAPGWSWGITGAEIVRGDDRQAWWLWSTGMFTVTKRIYLKESIPYAALRFSAGFSAAPSQYVHLTTSADLGSIGGLNLRAYTGFAFGMTGPGPFKGNFSTVPYVGFGASVLDFLNHERELEREWKDMEHSSWHIGLAEGMLLGSDAERSIFDPNVTGGAKPLVTGAIVRLAPATIALPLLDYRLALGTSALSFMALGPTQFGLGVLPIRLSYVSHPFGYKVTVEPFAEVSYAPSSWTHLGLRGALPVNGQISLHVQAGYVSGSTGSLRGVDIEGRVRNLTSFSGFYIGIGAGIMDRFFSRDELRYARD